MKVTIEWDAEISIPEGLEIVQLIGTSLHEAELNQELLSEIIERHLIYPMPNGKYYVAEAVLLNGKEIHYVIKEYPAEMFE